VQIQKGYCHTASRGNLRNKGFYFVPRRRERAGALWTWTTVKWEACQVKCFFNGEKSNNNYFCHVSYFYHSKLSILPTDWRKRFIPICCYRAESLLNNYHRQQQRDLALCYGKDIGMGIRRPLDLLNRDQNWPICMGSCFSFKCGYFLFYHFLNHVKCVLYINK